MQKEADSILARFMERLKTNKRFSVCVYGGAIVLALTLYFMGGSLNCKGETSDYEIPAQTETAAFEGDELEKRLTEVLSQIRGAGKVEVMVTYETRGELVTATMRQYDESFSETNGGETSTQTEQRQEITEVATITVSGGEEPIILVEREPEIRGVIVVAEGASDPFVKLDLQRAVSAVTGAPLSCIEVFEMTWSS
ncbi:MAG: hypothetical protein Q4C04_05845 [Clostridia bacterium]|nr:hypothetical protein [Clostridia bacterium]